MLDALDDGALAGRLDTAYYLGFGEYFCERYDDAIRHFRRGIAISRASGQGQFVIPMTIGLAHALEVRGRLDEAAEHADAAVDGARLWGNNQMLCFALTADAWVSAMRGDLDRARGAGTEAMALLEGLDESVLSRATRVHVAAAQLEAGDPERCLAAMSAGGAPEFAGVEPGRRAWLYAVLARAELALGRRSAAAEWVDRAERGVAGLDLGTRRPPCSAPARTYLDAAGRGAARCAGAPSCAASCGRRGRPGRAGAPARRPRAPDDDAAIGLLERAESELAACGAVRLRDEAARELRRRGVKATARRRRATGHGRARLPVRPRARGRRARRARAHQQGDRGASCSCPRRPSSRT